MPKNPLERLSRLNTALDMKYASVDLVGPWAEAIENLDPAQLGWALVVPHSNGVDWLWIAINQNLADMNGRPIEDHIGVTVASLHPKLAPAAYELLDRLRDGEREVQVRMDAEAASGKRKWIGTYRRVDDDAGELACVVALLQRDW